MEYVLIEQKAFADLCGRITDVNRKMARIYQEAGIGKEPGWVDNDTLSKMLDVKKRTLQNYRDNGIIPFTFIGNKVYYKLSDIGKILADGTIPALKKKEK